MDGLPALHVAQKAMVQEKVQPLKKMVGPHAPKHYQNSNRFSLEHLLLVVVVTVIITAFVTGFVLILLVPLLPGCPLMRADLYMRR